MNLIAVSAVNEPIKPRQFANYFKARFLTCKAPRQPLNSAGKRPVSSESVWPAAEGPEGRLLSKRILFKHKHLKALRAFSFGFL